MRGPDDRGLSRGDELVLRVKNPRGGTDRKRVRVNDFEQGRDASAARLESGGSVRFGRGGTVLIEGSRRREVLGVGRRSGAKLNDLERIISDFSRDDLAEAARSNGVGVPYRATKRQLAKSLLSVGAEPQYDEPSGRAEGRETREHRGRDEPIGWSIAEERRAEPEPGRRGFLRF